jgi:hypothetical protein
MFSYPPSPISLAHDNLVSAGSGFASAMLFGTGFGTGEGNITLANLVRCVASIEESLAVVVNPLQPLEFPRFDGTDDPISWLISYEHYFRVRQTPAHKHVAYSTFNLLDDAQLWYYRLPNDGSPPSWDQFVKLIVTRFVSPLTDKPISMTALISDLTALEGVSGSDVVAIGDDTLHADGDSDVPSSGDVLSVGDGSAMGADNGYNVSVAIGAIGSLDTGAQG